MQQIRQYFDNLAPQWDAMCHHDDQKVETIVTLLGLKKGSKVADIACGTGVLFPFLLAREPLGVYGIDLSPNMIAIARQKHADKRLHLTAGDVLDWDESGFDAAIVYSAYPHFADKAALAQKLKDILKPGGRFMVAHSESRQVIDARHQNGAQAVSVGLKPAKEEMHWFEAGFSIDIVADTDQIYILSGTKK